MQVMQTSYVLTRFDERMVDEEELSSADTDTASCHSNSSYPLTRKLGMQINSYVTRSDSRICLMMPSRRYYYIPPPSMEYLFRPILPTLAVVVDDDVVDPFQVS